MFIYLFVYLFYYFVKLPSSSSSSQTARLLNLKNVSGSFYYYYRYSLAALLLELQPDSKQSRSPRSSVYFFLNNINFLLFFFYSFQNKLELLDVLLSLSEKPHFSAHFPTLAETCFDLFYRM